MERPRCEVGYDEILGHGDLCRRRRPLGIGLATVPVTGSTPALAGSRSVSVPVSVLGGQGEPGGASPTVQITVGGWGPVSVCLDTGSSGLHVFAGAVNAGSGVTVSDQTSNITYAGGFHFQGVVASAVIRLGEATTTGPVPFALVQSAWCMAAKPDCPAADGIWGYESRGGRRRGPRHRNAKQRRRSDEPDPRHGWAAGQEVEPASRRQLGTARPGCSGDRQRATHRSVPTQIYTEALTAIRCRRTTRSRCA